MKKLLAIILIIGGGLAAAHIFKKEEPVPIVASAPQDLRKAKNRIQIALYHERAAADLQHQYVPPTISGATFRGKGRDVDLGTFAGVARQRQIDDHRKKAAEARREAAELGYTDSN